ncbi:TlpA family protein disulfide reductase [Novipirellula sp. SH528]|uniref:TlpA family protein disulfide reductase n=1 Tax=Novipirellula sp. SH528 TaxID=3454466 RepID=UPI003F9FB04F
MSQKSKRWTVAGTACFGLLACGIFVFNRERPSGVSLIPIGYLTGELPLESELETVRQPLQPTGDAEADAQTVLDSVQQLAHATRSFRVRQTRHYTGEMSGFAPIPSLIAGIRPNQVVLRYENWVGGLAFVSDGDRFRVNSEHELNPSDSRSQRCFLEGAAPDSLDTVLRHIDQLSLSPPTHAFPELELMALLPFTDNIAEFLGSRGWGTVKWIGSENLEGQRAEHLVCSGKVCRLKAAGGSDSSREAKPADPDSEPDESKLHLWIDAEGPALLRKASLNDFAMTYTDWALNPILPEKAFELPSSRGYQRIAFEFPEGGSWTGRQAPELEMQTLSGKSHQLVDYRGQVVVLDFWATWCGPCLRELPAVAEVVNEYSDQDVRLLAVTNESDVKKIRATLDRLDVNVEAVLDTNRQSSAFGVASIPHLVVIDRQGDIQAVHVGFTSGLQESLREELDRLTE